MAPRRLPTVVDDHLLPLDLASGEPIALGSPAWYDWLADPTHPSFSYQTALGSITVRRERKRNGWYWYAYRAHAGRLHKAYLGKAADLTPDRLRSIADTLTEVAVAPSSDVAAHQGAPAIRLSFFGVPQLLRDGRVVALTARKAQALLAYLAAHDRPQPRAQLLALLWPESDEALARRNLRNTLWRIRAALGRDLLQDDPSIGSGQAERLALSTRAWVDIRAFVQASHTASQPAALHPPLRAYQTMQRLYRGSFLEGFTLDGAPEFELWLTAARERFHELHLHALQELAGDYRAAARWPDVVTIAQTALAHDALHEPLYRALIEAYAQLGERATALRHYEALREMLDRELGVAPLPETEQLRADILSGRLVDNRPPTTGHQAGAIPTTIVRRSSMVGRRLSKEQPFIGRANELALLDAAWDAACAGQARVVFISGEAGIGKSRLWQIWSAQRRLSSPETGSAIVWAARCLPTTQHLPFAPLVDILRGPISRERLAARAQPMPPVWLADIVALVPELHDLAPDLPPPASLAPIDTQRRVFEALVQSLGLEAVQPLALFLDDLQWVDRASLDWLGYLLHRAQDRPLLLVGTYRPGEAPAPLAKLITMWERSGNIDQIALDRLSAEETTALIAALHGDQQRASVLYDQSAGNPYFLIELLRAEAGVVPVALTDLIAERLRRLSGTARQVLQAAAVLESAIDFASLHHTSGRSEEETLDALDALLAAGLLIEMEQQYHFGHPLIAHVVDAALSGARRAILHRRAAEGLERVAAERLTDVAGRLARHYREAGDTQQAAHYAELAGRHALGVGAPVEAVYFYEQAVALAPTPARYRGLGMAREQQGDLTGARAALELALHAYEQIGDGRGAAHVYLDLARTAHGISLEAVIEWVQRGRSYLEDHDDLPAQALAGYLLGTELRAAGRSLAEAATQLEQARALAVRADMPELVSSILLELGNVRAQQGDLAGAIASFGEMITHSHSAGEPLQEAIGYNNLAYHALLDGDLATAHAAAAAGLALAEARDIRPVLQWLYSTQGEIVLKEGRWAEAEAWFRRGQLEAQRFANAAQVIIYQVNLALVARGRGELGEAIAGLEAARLSAAALADPYLHSQLDLWLAEVYHQQGAVAHASQALQRAEVRLHGSDYAGLQAWATRVRSALDLAAG